MKAIEKRINLPVVITSLLVLAAALLSISFRPVQLTKTGTGDSLLSKQAFMTVYPVFMHPRCVNCHPAGDVPLMEDAGKPHAQGVKRGKEGKGMYASKCVNCHTDSNQPGFNMPPGVPDWHMPPAAKEMEFQGKSARELAALLIDTAANGGKSREALLQHVSSDPLVLWGWNPGEGRTTPPLPHADFARQFSVWIDNGAYLPD